MEILLRRQYCAAVVPQIRFVKFTGGVQAICKHDWLGHPACSFSSSENRSCTVHKDVFWMILFRFNSVYLYNIITTRLSLGTAWGYLSEKLVEWDSPSMDMPLYSHIQNISWFCRLGSYSTSWILVDKNL